MQEYVEDIIHISLLQSDQKRIQFFIVIKLIYFRGFIQFECKKIELWFCHHPYSSLHQQQNLYYYHLSIIYL